MVNLAQVQMGIEKYIENEIIAKIVDWRKWVVGAGASMALSRSTDIFNQIKEHPVIKAMHIIDDNDLIDIDKLHTEFAKQAQRGAVTFDIPLMGALTLNASDVDRLYSYIMGG